MRGVNFGEFRRDVVDCEMVRIREGSVRLRNEARSGRMGNSRRKRAKEK